MLLDKNPRAGFLSPHAPAGAARLQADCPGFAARLRRSGAAGDRAQEHARWLIEAGPGEGAAGET